MEVEERHSCLATRDAMFLHSARRLYLIRSRMAAGEQYYYSRRRKCAATAQKRRLHLG
jgi:hypothetical protein